jgi:hypothetical protein
MVGLICQEKSVALSVIFCPFVLLSPKMLA